MGMLDDIPLEVMRSMADPDWDALRPGETADQRDMRIASTTDARQALAAQLRKAALPKEAKP